MTAGESLAALRQAREELAAAPDFEAETTEPLMRALATDLGFKVGPVFGIVRVAVTGKKVTPPLFETMDILGQAKCLDRIDQAIGRWPLWKTEDLYSLRLRKGGRKNE